MEVKYHFKDSIIEYKYNPINYKTFCHFIQGIKDIKNIYLFGSFINVLYGRVDMVDDIDLFYIGEEVKDTKPIIELAKEHKIAVDIFYLPNYIDDNILNNKNITIVNKDIESLVVYRDYHTKEVNDMSRYTSNIDTELGYEYKFKNSLNYRLKDQVSNNENIKVNPIRII